MMTTQELSDQLSDDAIIAITNKLANHQPSRDTPLLKEISARHKRIAMLSVTGAKNIEIADAVGLTPVRVSQVLNEPLTKAYMDNLTERVEDDVLDIRQALTDLAPKAVSALENCLKSADDKLRLAAAKDVLDRTGYKPTETRLNINGGIFSPERQAELQKRMDAAKKQGIIVDILPISED